MIVRVFIISPSSLLSPYECQPRFGAFTDNFKVIAITLSLKFAPQLSIMSQLLPSQEMLLKPYCCAPRIKHLRQYKVRKPTSAARYKRPLIKNTKSTSMEEIGQKSAVDVVITKEPLPHGPSIPKVIHSLQQACQEIDLAIYAPLQESPDTESNTDSMKYLTSSSQIKGWERGLYSLSHEFLQGNISLVELLEILTVLLAGMEHFEQAKERLEQCIGRDWKKADIPSGLWEGVEERWRVLTEGSDRLGEYVNDNI
ncbi:hypothetical protein B0O99DRAFT_299631 [Bisporella sp. PMI_857]|nr:hypothetical protein B0O99DRAFT_299631 [Bisporella sp. PMI_857]